MIFLTSSSLSLAIPRIEINVLWQGSTGRIDLGPRKMQPLSIEPSKESGNHRVRKQASKTNRIARFIQLQTVAMLLTRRCYVHGLFTTLWHNCVRGVMEQSRGMMLQRVACTLAKRGHTILLSGDLGLIYSPRMLFRSERKSKRWTEKDGALKDGKERDGTERLQRRRRN